MQLTFATQASALARWRTAHVIRLLKTAHPGLECVELILETSARCALDAPLLGMGDKALFTSELEEALLAGTAHAVVHSLKDLPIAATHRLVIAAIAEREPVHDALVSSEAWPFSDLPQGARVGTNSRRRAAQLLARRPDLHILHVGGSIHTRVRKVIDHEYEAIVLAQAGLTRLGLQAHISEIFPLNVMLPAPGQGALAVQCRENDSRALELLSVIHDSPTAEAVAAESAFRAGLRKSISLPIAAYAEKNRDSIILTGAVMSPDGRQEIRLSVADKEPQRLGERLAALILERGAAELSKPGLRVERT